MPGNKIIIAINDKAALSVKRLKKRLCSLDVDTPDNKNIGKESLGKQGLHLNPRGSGEKSYKTLSKTLRTSKKWYDAGGFQDSYSISEGNDVKANLANSKNCTFWN